MSDSLQDLVEALAVRSAQLAVEPATTSWHNFLWHEVCKLKKRVLETAEQTAGGAVFDSWRGK